MHDDGPEEDLPLETAPASIPVSLRNFADAAAAELFGHLIANTVRAISRYIDLERLDGITVAYNYDEALAELDRGVTTSRPLRRTHDDQKVGVGMSPAVLRDGVVKAHLLLLAPLVLPLEDTSSEGFGLALHLVAHECAHIEDLKHRDACFPGLILQREITDSEEIVLERLAGGIWEEYAACRASAAFGRDQTSIYDESLAASIRTGRIRVTTAIKSYRLHTDVDRLLDEAGGPLCDPLRFYAYLIGHLDALDSELDAAPVSRDLLAGSRYEPFFSRLRDTLGGLWSRRGRWESLAEFSPIRDIARELLADGGMILRRQADGSLYVDVPFTPGTMP